MNHKPYGQQRASCHSVVRQLVFSGVQSHLSCPLSGLIQHCAIFILNFLWLSCLIGHSRGLSQGGPLTMKKPSFCLLGWLQCIICTHGVRQSSTQSRAHTHQGNANQSYALPLIHCFHTNTPPHQAWIPEVYPDSCHYLRTSQSKTQAKEKVGEGF